MSYWTNEQRNLRTAVAIHSKTGHPDVFFKDALMRAGGRPKGDNMNVSDIIPNPGRKVYNGNYLLCNGKLFCAIEDDSAGKVWCYHIEKIWRNRKTDIVMRTLTGRAAHIPIEDITEVMNASDALLWWNQRTAVVKAAKESAMDQYNKYTKDDEDETNE